MDDEGSSLMRVPSLGKVLGVAAIAAVVSAHVGSPDVFFSGNAGPYAIRVVVRPPEVVPGIAQVTVHAPTQVTRVAIRPVFWRAGSRGAPSADEMRRLQDTSGTFVGSLWLMARGAYSVDVVVDGARGHANVLVPVPSVATGRLALDPALGAVLGVLGLVLVVGLVNIVMKGAGESLVDPGEDLDPVRARRARRAAAIAVPVIALALLGGARWWNVVDADYQRRIYHPLPMKVEVSDSGLAIRKNDVLIQTSGRQFALVPDHGKLMHLFLVKAEDARVFAHLHPRLSADSTVLSTSLPPLPAGEYRAYGDVVDQTGFERTIVGDITLRDSSRGAGRMQDADDGWYVGDASREPATRLADGSTMQMEIVPNGVIPAEREETIRISVRDASGNAAVLEPYLGMSAHAVVLKPDGSVYVHLHPMGTVTQAARDAFLARDRGDTTADGRLVIPTEARDLQSHSAHSPAATIEFPYAFPKSGSYRIFVQVKRNGRVLTGAFAVPVVEGLSSRTQ